MDIAEHIARWEAAGLLSPETAAAIREYEAAQVKPGGRQWQVILALILGGILLGAGVLLFVAAHWDNVSPLARLGLVLAMLVFFHGLALLVRERFSGLATALHAIGTVSAEFHRRIAHLAEGLRAYLPAVDGSLSKTTIGQRSPST